MKKEIVLQSVMIFLSVFLGIMAGNWNQNRQDHQRTKNFIKNLIVEFESNKSKIEKSIPYHTKLESVGDSLFNNLSKAELSKPLMEIGGFSMVKQWKGLGLAPGENSVFQSGNYGGIFENIPIELLTKISKLKFYQDEYHRFSQSIGDKLLNINAETKLIDFAILIEILGSDMKNLEIGMVKAYQEVIDLMKTTKID